MHLSLTILSLQPILPSSPSLIKLPSPESPSPRSGARPPSGSPQLSLFTFSLLPKCHWWHLSVALNCLAPWLCFQVFGGSGGFKPPAAPSYSCMFSALTGFVLAPHPHTTLPQGLCTSHTLCLECSPHFPCLVNSSVSFRTFLEGHSLQDSPSAATTHRCSSLSAPSRHSLVNTVMTLS